MHRALLTVVLSFAIWISCRAFLILLEKTIDSPPSGRKRSPLATIAFFGPARRLRWRRYENSRHRNRHDRGRARRTRTYPAAPRRALPRPPLHGPRSRLLRIARKAALPELRRAIRRQGSGDESDGHRMEPQRRLARDRSGARARACASHRALGQSGRVRAAQTYCSVPSEHHAHGGECDGACDCGRLIGEGLRAGARYFLGGAGVLSGWVVSN